MDILEIDAVNFAGRVGHVAAAEICGLLTHGEIKPVADWYSVSELEPEHDLGPDIDRMAAYVVQRNCAGETLFRNLDLGEWDEAPEAISMAFKVFALTTHSVAENLLRDQKAAEHALDVATRPAAAKVALEDTIFEPEEALGAMRPEAVAASAQLAELERLKKADARAKRKARAAAKRAEKAEAEAREAQAELATAAAAGPLSIGEAPAAPPVNRGGRGRRKAQG